MPHCLTRPLWNELECWSSCCADTTAEKLPASIDIYYWQRALNPSGLAHARAA